MDYIKHMLAQDGAAQAQADYTQALMDPETPEQAAVRLRHDARRDSDAYA